MTDQVVYVPTSALRPADWNPRIVMTPQFRQLVSMIRADPGFLLARPVLAMDDGTIYAGNQRYRAVCQLYRDGWESPLWPLGHVPAILSPITEAEAKARAIRDNTHAGHWQELALAEALVEIASASGEDTLPTLGLTDTELTNILATAGVTDPVHPVTGRDIDVEARSGAQEGQNPPSPPTDAPTAIPPLSVVLVFEHEVQREQAMWYLGRAHIRRELGYPSMAAYGADGEMISQFTPGEHGHV